MKKNIWRIVFWGIMAVLSLVLGVLGYLEDSVNVKRDEEILEKIVPIFNSSSRITEYISVGSRITASVDRRKIVVSYSGASESEYVYTYKSGILTSQVGRNDTIGNNILVAMTDAVAVYNGEMSGNTFNLFDTNEIVDYTIDKGISLKYNTTTIDIKINTNVAVKPEVPIVVPEKISYFLIEDFLESDKTDYTLSKSKENISLLRESEFVFTITEKDRLTNDSLESIKNVLSFFYDTSYSTKLDNINLDNKVNYEDDTIMFEFIQPSEDVSTPVLSESIKVTIKENLE